MPQYRRKAVVVEAIPPVDHYPYWTIKGPNGMGEHLTPEEFAATYEPVSDAQVDQGPQGCGWKDCPDPWHRTQPEKVSEPAKPPVNTIQSHFETAEQIKATEIYWEPKPTDWRELCERQHKYLQMLHDDCDNPGVCGVDKLLAEAEEALASQAPTKDSGPCSQRGCVHTAGHYGDHMYSSGTGWHK